MSELLTLLSSHTDSNRTAITEIGVGSKSYGEVFEYTHQLKTFLAQKGVKKNHRILLLFQPSFLFVCIILACIEMGVTVILIDPSDNQELFEKKVMMSQPDWIFIDHRLAVLQYHPILKFVVQKLKPGTPIIRDLRKYRYIADKKSVFLPFATSFPNYQKVQVFHKRKKTMMDGSQEALMVFTSGTTDHPKAVVHTHHSLAKSLRLIVDLSHQMQPVFYTNQAYFLLFGLALGSHVIFNPKPFHPMRFIEDSLLYSPTLAFGPPGEFLQVIQYCRQHNLPFPASYRELFLGSAPVTQSFLKKLYAVSSSSLRTVCLYGMTEVLPIAMVEGKEKLSRSVDGDLLGSFFSGVKAKVHKGELIITAPHMSPRYLGQPTHSKIHTGDFVKVHGKELILKGRKKDMILRRSFNIYPALYESTVEKIPGVLVACFIGVFDEQIEDERVFLIIEPDDTAQLTQDSVMQFLKFGKTRIDPLALPDHIIFQKLPRFGRQLKIDKKSLRDQLKKVKGGI